LEHRLKRQHTELLRQYALPQKLPKILLELPFSQALFAFRYLPERTLPAYAARRLDVVYYHRRLHAFPYPANLTTHNCFLSLFYLLFLFSLEKK
jgi:hypothetical protein